MFASDHDDARELRTEAAGLSSEEVSRLIHDLRSQLHSVLGYVELLEMEGAGPLTPEQIEYLESIRSAGQKVLDQLERARGKRPLEP